MTYQTAAGARAVLLAKIKAVLGPIDIREDAIDPETMPAEGLFATLQEGGDFTLGTIIGGESTLYEVYSVAAFDVLTLHKDKALEAALRADVIAALEADYTLGGAVDDVRIVSAENLTEYEEAAGRSRSTSITLELHYLSASPVG